MMKRNIYITFAGLLLFISAACTDLFVNSKSDGTWQTKTSGQIVINYRQAGYSYSASPSSGAVDTILANQLYYLNALKDSLKLNFANTVMVYLYNYDEAKDKIGTNTGGFARPESFTYYYTFNGSNGKKNIMGVKDYIGAHELTHVFTDNVLGGYGSKLFSEGYAVYFNDNYAGRSVKEWMKLLAPLNKIVSIEQLINNNSIDEGIYYPNAAYFIGYLRSVYGNSKVNNLYSLAKGDLPNKFTEVLGRTMAQLQVDYTAYCTATLN